MCTKIGFIRLIGVFLKKNNFSSFHKLNADRGLTKIKKIYWLFYNFINNTFSLSTDRKLKVNNSYFRSMNIKRIEKHDTRTPARYVSDAFWDSVDWERLRKDLCEDIQAVEVGCGGGKYAKVILENLNEDLHSYTGVDHKANSNWEKFSTEKKISFQVADSAQLGGILNGKNLIITQSALEHFDEDIVFMESINEHVLKYKKPVVQIHLMPSPACLYKYLWHGVRQYNPRTVSKLTKIFDKNTTRELISLGGRNCNKVHRKFITYPLLFKNIDRRFDRNPDYIKSLNRALIADRKIKKPKASFYALIMNSNFIEYKI